MSSEDYHGLAGVYSSSQLKEALKDDETFIKKYITKEIERESNAAFDLGTYLHTAILEPDKLKKECAVYPGRTRAGPKWKEFASKNKGKTIITKTQEESSLRLVSIIKKSKKAQHYLKGKKEVTLIVELHVFEGEIYAPYYGMKLDPVSGWVKSDYLKKRDGAFVIWVKVRADNLGNVFVSDLKSTTGNAKSEESMSYKIEQYGYELSAALYLDIFNLMLDNSLEYFVWIFASKDCNNSGCYESDNEIIQVGRMMWITAIKKIADMSNNDWKTVEYVGKIRPTPNQRRWLQQNDADIL